MVTGIVRTVAAIIALTASGCTIVRVSGPARVTTSTHFGVLRIAPDGPGAIIYHAAGVGFVPGLHGATIGIGSETAALIFDRADCRIVLFAPQVRDVQQLRTLLAPVVRERDICSTGGK